LTNNLQLYIVDTTKGKNDRQTKTRNIS